MLITNQDRKKQIRSFIDKDHCVRDKFYGALYSDRSGEKMIKSMRALIDEDGDFYDPYIFIIDAFFAQQKEDEAVQLLKIGYERAIKTIVDVKGRWPKEMLWDFLENRHVMRMIEEYAVWCWRNENIEEALPIFRNLLKVNPHDNQGARYDILAIKMGLRCDEWEQPFRVEEDGVCVGLNAIALHRWFKENAPMFPDEFDWLLKLYKSWHTHK